MTDQVQSLKTRGVSAVPGKFSLLFAAPEALIDVQGWREMMLSPPLCDQLVAIAVDEAHCVSKW